MLQRKFRAIPNRIDFAMTEKGISAEQVGRLAGHADGSYIRRMRRGEKRAMKATLQTAEALVQLTGLPLDYLFQEVDPHTGHDLPSPTLSKTPGTERVAS